MKSMNYKEKLHKSSTDEKKIAVKGSSLLVNMSILRFGEKKLRTHYSRFSNGGKSGVKDSSVVDKICFVLKLNFHFP